VWVGVVFFFFLFFFFFFFSLLFFLCFFFFFFFFFFFLSPLFLECFKYVERYPVLPFSPLAIVTARNFALLPPPENGFLVARLRLHFPFVSHDSSRADLPRTFPFSVERLSPHPKQHQYDTQTTSLFRRRTDARPVSSSPFPFLFPCLLAGPGVLPQCQI